MTARIDSGYLLALGMKLHSFGLVPLALEKGHKSATTAKKPIMDGWQKSSHPDHECGEGFTTATTEAIKSDAWGWGKARGIGLLLGSGSGGLACIDLETMAVASAFEKDESGILGANLVNKLRSFPWSKTPEGIHIIVRLDFQTPPKMDFKTTNPAYRKETSNTAIELLGQGQQCAIPSTMDTTGDGHRKWLAPPINHVSKWPTITKAEWDCIVRSCGDICGGDNEDGSKFDTGEKAGDGEDGYLRANRDTVFQGRALDALLGAGGYRITKTLARGGHYLAKGDGAHTATWGTISSLKHGYPLFKNFDSDFSTKPMAPTDVVRHIECGGDDKRLKDLLKDLGFWRGSTTAKDTATDNADDEMEPVEKAPMEPFPVSEVFPSEIADFVREGSKALMADPAMLAVPMMATVAAAIGARRYVRINHKWKEPCALWCILAVESGGNKSACIELATSPLVELDQAMRQEYASEYSEYTDELRQYNDTPKAERGQPPQKPHPHRVWVADTTIEKLGVILGENPRGVLVCRDELTGWFGSMTKYSKSDDSGTWLSFHDGKPTVIDRQKNPVPISLDKPLASLTGGIQPGLLAKHLNAEAWQSGLAQRILAANPPVRLRVYADPPQLISGERDYRAAITFLVESLKEQERATPTAITDPYAAPVEMDEEAFAIWKDDHDKRCARAFGAKGGRSSQIYKLVSTSARWALCHHMLKSALRKDQGYTMIDADSVMAGINAADWFERESMRLMGLQAGAVTAMALEPIIRLAVGAGERGVSPRETRNALRKLCPDVATAEELLEQLVAEGHLVKKLVLGKRKRVLRYLAA